MGKPKPPPDFKKTKKKVGKTKKAPRNETRTDFKAAKIYMPHQHAIASKTNASTKRNVNLTDILGHVKHHNANVRASAFTQMRELFADSDGLLSMHLGHIVEATSLTALDLTPQVRKEYRTFLRRLLCEVPVDLQPFYPFLHLQIKASLTHVDPYVRKDGLVLLELFLAHPAGPRIVRGCSRTVVELLVQIGAKTPVDASLLRILRQVLSLGEGELTKANEVSIQDMLATGKANARAHTAGLAELALRTYMEAGEGINGLQLKLNACALLEKVDNPPWGDMAKRLFVEFPLSTHCPPNTNRAVYCSLVTSVNLHIASLMASSPQHPSASSSLAYLETMTKQLKASDGSSIDDDEGVALQSIAAKVTHIITILRREVGHRGADAAIARIIGQLCLPKKETAAELKSSRMLLMIPFVDDMRDIFDHETATPWIQVWPKILWSSAKSRSELLHRILALARSCTVLFKKIQRFLLPFYIGIDVVPAPLLQCCARDQAIAISTLFYLQGNWNKLMPKIVPLLKSSLDQHAKDLLLDILIIKDVQPAKKLRLLLSMLLQKDESWRKAACYTVRVDNYWTTVAYPLAQRAREIDESSSWLEYLIACAQPMTQVLAHLLQCIAACPDRLISELIAALYRSASCASEAYEVACKQCFVSNNVRLLEALILDKKHHSVATDGWGEGAMAFLSSDPVVAKATVNELRTKLACWNFPLLPML